MTVGLVDGPADPVDGRERFLRQLAEVVATGRLRRLRLNRPIGQPDLVRVEARAILLKGVPTMSFVWHHAQRDITRNLPMPEALNWIRSALGSEFGGAVLTTDQRVIELGFSRKGKPLLRSRAAEVTPVTPVTPVATLAVAAVAAGPDGAGIDAPGTDPDPDAATPAGTDANEHNRRKPRWIDASRPFLSALGVTDSRGVVIPAMSRKWRQIDRFVGVFVGAWRDAALDPAIGRAGRPIRIVDFGAGKGYLTFALYDYLTSQGLAVRVTGVERRPDLVIAGNRIAAELGFHGLDFVAGDIVQGAGAGSNSDASAAPAGTAAAEESAADGSTIDVMIALHACDTATDDALFRGLQARAAILVCSPCCHKELRPQLLAPHPLAPLMKHGIQRGEMAEMVTDTMRALLLEARGYETSIFEFVSLEHTARNRMILAIRRRHATDVAAITAQYDALKTFHGVQAQRLEALLADVTGPV